MKKKKILFIIISIFLLIVILPLNSCYSVPTDPEDNEEEIREANCIVEANDVEFNFRKYIKYESEIYDYDFYIFDVIITNNNSSTIEIETSYFSINTIKVSMVKDNELYFHGLICDKNVQTEILLKVEKGFDIKDVVLEIDFGILSWGATLTLGKVAKNESNELFENVLINKFNCIKLEHLDLIYTIIKNENIGILSNCTYTYIEDLKEDTYILSTSDENYSLSIDENGIYNLMHFYQGTVYDVYIDSVRNPYYLKTSRIIAEFASEKWQGKIKNFVNTYYTEASCSNFKWGRMETLENAMGISFNVKGKNAYGMTLTKSGVIYLTYNFEKDEFETSYFKIGDDILEDNRLTVSFETNTVEDITSRKVMKGATITKPTLTVNKNGYQFVGWKIKGTNELFDFNTRITSNTTLVAVWEENPLIECQLIIDETISNVDSTIVNLEYSARFSLPVPYKNLYEFKYWYYINENDVEIKLTDNRGSCLTTFNIKESIKIYPKFEYSPVGGLTDIEYEYNESENGYYIVGFKGSGDIFFPEMYEGKEVIGIKRNSFNAYLPDAKNITSIIFPKTIKYIEDDFIHYSTHVENSLYIYFENPDSIVSLGYSQRITSLNTIIIGKNCSEIKYMFVKNANIKISKDNPYYIVEGDALYSKDFKTLFYVNTNEEIFSVNKLVEKISSKAFINCVNLKELHLSDSLKEVESYSFFINGGYITKYYFYNTNVIEIIDQNNTLCFATDAPITFFVPIIDYNPFGTVVANIEINPYLE